MVEQEATEEEKDLVNLILYRGYSSSAPAPTDATRIECLTKLRPHVQSEVEKALNENDREWIETTQKALDLEMINLKKARKEAAEEAIEELIDGLARQRFSLLNSMRISYGNTAWKWDDEKERMIEEVREAVEKAKKEAKKL